jgi:hypothetical protein
MVHALARAIFSGLRNTGERAVAAAAKATAKDVRRVVTESDKRLRRFIQGCEKIEASSESQKDDDADTE